jgi:hypothetical protein
MPKGATIVVLCEDLQSRVFVVRVLARMGHDRRSIRVEMAPPGEGAAERYVREQYPSWVGFLRSRSSTKGLVVHIDADPTHTVAERHAELATSLSGAGKSPRGPREPIAELVPKRNIETWIYALDPSLAADLPKPLDEVEAFPKLVDRESRCAVAAEAFADHARRRTEPAAAATVPSLLDGLAEFRRLP